MHEAIKKMGNKMTYLMLITFYNDRICVFMYAQVEDISFVCNLHGFR